MRFALRRSAASARVEVSVARDLRSTTATHSFVHCAKPRSQPCLRSFYRSTDHSTSFHHRPVDEETKLELPLREAPCSLSICLDLDHELLALLSSEHSREASLSCLTRVASRLGIRASKKSSSRETAHIGARILRLRFQSVPAGLRASSPKKVIGAVKQAATTAMHGAMGARKFDQTPAECEKQTSLARRATSSGAHWPREGPLPLALAPIVDPAHRRPRKM